MIDSPHPIVIEREIIGAGRTWDDRNLLIVATAHDREWPGLGDRVTFAVEIQGDGEKRKPISFGFFYQEEAFRFCTARKMRKTQFSASGEAYTEAVDGLGLPDGLIARYAYELS